MVTEDPVEVTLFLSPALASGEDLPGEGRGGLSSFADVSTFRRVKGIYFLNLSSDQCAV